MNTISIYNKFLLKGGEITKEEFNKARLQIEKAKNTIEKMGKNKLETISFEEITNLEEVINNLNPLSLSDLKAEISFEEKNLQHINKQEKYHRNRKKIFSRFFLV